ncbi:hypothetical protein [Streptomyces sp. NPDC001389]|uniref:hypothetical protein n=1 Tax=Streptomyces sp. NPDC001389 TaxID=3364569 RepID=UPI0036A0EE12
MAAVLPSRDEAATIAAVATAVDRALNDPEAVIVNVDCSTDQSTSQAFLSTPTLAQKVPVAGVSQGKGSQVLHGLALLPPGHGAVLVADTDTRNPHADMYRKLLDAVRGGSALAAADYRRFWDEGNLTHHVARPLLAAATGIDLAQPLAGDIALSPDTVRRAAADRLDLTPSLSACVDGYGIDAFLVMAAAGTGQPVTSVPLDRTKEHAPSFPHLPAIFRQAVPVLLALTGQGHARQAPAATYSLAQRTLTDDRLHHMLTELDRLSPPHPDHQSLTWPRPLFDAWTSVQTGADPVDAAATLWPFYIQRVRSWLATGASARLRVRRARLAIAHAELTRHITDRTTHGSRPS